MGQRDLSFAINFMKIGPAIFEKSDTHTHRKCSARRAESSDICHLALWSTFILSVLQVIAEQDRAKSPMVEYRPFLI